MASCRKVPDETQKVEELPDETQKIEEVPDETQKNENHPDVVASSESVEKDIKRPGELHVTRCLVLCNLRFRHFKHFGFVGYFIALDDHSSTFNVEIQ